MWRKSAVYVHNRGKTISIPVSLLFTAVLGAVHHLEVQWSMTTNNRDRAIQLERQIGNRCAKDGCRGRTGRAKVFVPFSRPCASCAATTSRDEHHTGTLCLLEDCGRYVLVIQAR